MKGERDHNKKVAKIRKEAGRIRKLYETEIAKLRSEGAPAEKIQSEQASERWEVFQTLDEAIWEDDAFWRAAARAHSIEPPLESDADSWQETSMFGDQKFLSERAIIRIRAAIKKDRRELATLVIGIVGAVTGLVAVVLTLVKS